MYVRVLDRSGWGSDRVWPKVVLVKIADTCPICGGPRGDPRPFRGSEDGEQYVCDVWDNECGHTDQYRDVMIEAKAEQARIGGQLIVGTT